MRRRSLGSIRTLLLISVCFIGSTGRWGPGKVDAADTLQSKELQWHYYRLQNRCRDAEVYVRHQVEEHWKHDKSIARKFLRLLYSDCLANVRDSRLLSPRAGRCEMIMISRCSAKVVFKYVFYRGVMHRSCWTGQTRRGRRCRTRDSEGSLWSTRSRRFSSSAAPESSPAPISSISPRGMLLIWYATDLLPHVLNVVQRTAWLSLVAIWASLTCIKYWHNSIAPLRNSRPADEKVESLLNNWFPTHRRGFRIHFLNGGWRSLENNSEPWRLSLAIFCSYHLFKTYVSIYDLENEIW